MAEAALSAQHRSTATSKARQFVTGGQPDHARVQNPVGERRAEEAHEGPPIVAQRNRRTGGRALQVDIAGVDLLESKWGPMVIEVNNSAGVVGIQEATGLDLASDMISFVVDRAASARADVPI